MPNQSVWGNPDDNQIEEQDLVTKINPDEGDQAIIRVNDGNNNDEDRPAIFAKNSNAGADARALKVEGKSELDGALQVSGAVQIGLGEVTGEIRVGEFDGTEETEPNFELIADDDGTAELTVGKVEFEGDDGEGNPVYAISPGLDLNLNSDGTGSLELGVVDCNLDPENSNPAPRTRMRIEANTPGNSGARIEALIYEPGTQFHAESTLHLNNDPGTSDVIVSHGDQQEAQFNAATVRVLSPRMTLGNIDGQVHEVGHLDGNGSEDELLPDPLDLKIGTRILTGDLTLGRIGRTCAINSALEIGADEDDPALLDAALDDADPRELKIGTQASTDDITLSRAGKDVNVADDLNVGGDLKVGPTDDGGVIDSGGTPAAIQHLKIGTGTGTKDVTIGRAGRTVDMMAQARMNSNGIVMNGASSVTDAAGIGFVVNAVGHGNGASIDFYINGVVEGWLDSTGFVNA